MKRKSLNVPKLKQNLLEDKKVTNLYSKLKKNLSKNKNCKSLIIAVSGGPDSMALAGLANMIVEEKRYKIYFALVDHGIRKNSHKEALGVKKLLKKQNMKLKILTNKKKIIKNIQKNARDIRYELLTKFCNKNKSKFLVTAHHQDDQIETFFIRLSRGSGIEGLSSMSEKTKIKNNIILLRPFLEINKKDLSYVAKRIFGKSIKDPTNSNKKFLRTKIRDLKKILEQKGLDIKSIARSIKNISSTKDAINFYVSKSMRKFVKFKKKETILNLSDFKKEPEEIKFRIINRVVRMRAKTYYPPRSQKVLNLINRFEDNKLKKCTLGGCMFEKRKNLLHVSREF
jgi:tRNA(Ile)-lysidine synthase|tara:strand:+ start:985 stop:2007 length:1023 start_codon:yes stop_codon:yes gene_type:complete